MVIGLQHKRKIVRDGIASDTMPTGQPRQSYGRAGSGGGSRVLRRVQVNGYPRHEIAREEASSAGKVVLRLDVMFQIADRP
jgi:hypothetical protein